MKALLWGVWLALAVVAIALVSLSTGPPTESAMTSVVVVGWTDTELQEGVKDICDRALVSLDSQPTTSCQVIYAMEMVKVVVEVDQGGDTDVQYHLLCFHSPLGERTLVG